MDRIEFVSTHWVHVGHGFGYILFYYNDFFSGRKARYLSPWDWEISSSISRGRCSESADLIHCKNYVYRKLYTIFINYNLICNYYIIYKYTLAITHVIILLFIIAFGMFCKYRRTKNKPMNLDNITTFAFLGLEMQFIHTFHMIGRLYSDLNNYVESGLINDLERIRQARQRNLVLYTFCKKFNSHYNMDLIILLSCYQLYVLLVLFKLMNDVATSIATEK